MTIGPRVTWGVLLLAPTGTPAVGGTSPFGGRGGIGNTIMGLFVLGVLNNGLDHVKIDSFIKILIRGIILLVALIINIYAERLRTTRSERAGRADARLRICSQRWRGSIEAACVTVSGLVSESYCFGAGMADALNGGGVFLSFAS